VVALLLGACTSEQAVTAPPPPAPVDAATASPDSDGDGLCDATEEEFGTGPGAVDSDGDALPDLIELLNGFDATDPAAPAADQLAYLEARRGGSTDFAVRATVDGDGQGVRGSFTALTSIYADGLSAADFFAGAAAIAALPEDGARSINEGSAYFASVLGRTRLVFNLRFDYAFDRLGALDCARVYPFRYTVKTDGGQTRADRAHLLIVLPEGTFASDADHCLPDTCQ
jgi:hypothetical protein